jgi:acid phosphatase (class A)
MKSEFDISLRSWSRSIGALGLFLALVISPLPSQAGSWLASGRPDALALLPPPPAPGSVEQAADLAATISVFKACTPADRALAQSEKKFFIDSFTPVVGAFFVPGKLPKTEEFFQAVAKETSAVLDCAKDSWKRPRPYVLEPVLANGEPEKSFSYPSGHSTRATVFALLLADLVPDKRDAILEMGRNIGWRRVEIGRHYPTDIYAGRTLAQAIVRELKASPDFQRAMAEVRAELQAAQHQ